MLEKAFKSSVEQIFIKFKLKLNLKNLKLLLPKSLSKSLYSKASNKLKKSQSFPKISELKIKNPSLRYEKVKKSFFQKAFKILSKFKTITPENRLKAHTKSFYSKA